MGQQWRTASAFILYFSIHPAIFTASTIAQEIAGPATDAAALLLLKDSFTEGGDALSSWSFSSATSPCGWFGVICVSGVVTGLRLAKLGLSGTVNVTALSHVKGLRSISLNDNKFSGPLPPDLSTLGSIKSLFLSHNAFSGEIPDGIFASMCSLKKLWLNDNQFTGRIPSSICNAHSKLIELRLEDNAFDGTIPTFDHISSTLKSFNASNNQLRGPIPASLARFSAASFAGNPGLCGPPLDSGSCGTAPSMEKDRARTHINVVVGVVAAVLIILLALALVALLFCRRRRNHQENLDAASADALESGTASVAAVAGTGSTQKEEKNSEATSGRKSGGPSRGPTGMAGLVMINEEKGAFGLAELMKAAAEVLGNGGLGSAYKVAMANGFTVVVKRLCDMNRVGKEAFDGEMRRLGSLRHPNVLTPLAYHYRKEEKLLVSEYVPTGSLRKVLHGDRGAEQRALDWPTRLKIALGIARGMAYLHAELASLDVPHGNLKSSNILLADNFEPLIADHGLVPLVGVAKASQVMFAYRTPEGTQHRLVSPKSDVFCFGVVILELVTGKFPSQYAHDTNGAGTDVVQQAASAIVEKREADVLDGDIAAPDTAPGIVRLLRVAAACVDANPEQRPEMSEVAELVQEIASG
ncbi:pollen receptor-like kinase 3 [Curcuma longa]|uniref:pollen receptor-like kinase 3 n=1 Tax=Curcuma longa TaxID=136217 RepID=UPI003D9EDB1F